MTHHSHLTHHGAMADHGRLFQIGFQCLRAFRGIDQITKKVALIVQPHMIGVEESARITAAHSGLYHPISADTPPVPLKNRGHKKLPPALPLADFDTVA